MLFLDSYAVKSKINTDVMCKKKFKLYMCCATATPLKPLFLYNFKAYNVLPVMCTFIYIF